jgi:hypothetical protein
MTRRGETCLLTAVVISLPILLIRVLYSMLSTFSSNIVFNPVIGSEFAELFMAAIEEMVVVLIYIWVGLKQDSVLAKEGDSNKSTLLHRAGRGDFGGGKLGILSLGAAVIDAVRGERELRKECTDNVDLEMRQ